MRRARSGFPKRHPVPALLSQRAEELAQRLVRALEEGRLVGRFVEAYATEFGRRALRADALRYGELLATIGREALLVMVARVSQELPRHLSRSRPPVLREPQARAAKGFSDALVGGLARAARWTAAEAEEFRWDADLYARLNARRSGARSAGRGGPFVDRCALLLDPSMLEKAQQAAGKFLPQLEQVAEKHLRAVFLAPRGS